MRAATTIARAATRLTWPFVRLDRNRGRLAPAVLCYHRVLPRRSGSQSARYSVTAEQFRQQMSLLAGEGFTSLTLDEFRRAAAGADEVPSRSVLVTFDDGFADIYLNAWPIAREFGIALNLFLCSGLLGGESVESLQPRTPAEKASQCEFPNLWRPLTWDQVREMSRGGVGLGFHSHTHRNYGRLSTEELVSDASRGLSVMERDLGTRPCSFAFPYGHHGSYSAEAIAELKQLGLEIFFTTEMNRTALPGDNPISRLVIHPEDDIQSFRRKLYGGYEWVGTLRRFSYSFAASLRQESRAASQV